MAVRSAQRYAKPYDFQKIRIDGNNYFNDASFW